MSRVAGRRIGRASGLVRNLIGIGFLRRVSKRRHLRTSESLITRSRSLITRPLTILPSLVPWTRRCLLSRRAIGTHLPEPRILINNLDIIAAQQALPSAASQLAVVPLQMHKDALPRLALVVRALDHVDSLHLADVQLPEDSIHALLGNVGKHARDAQTGNIKRNGCQIDSLARLLGLNRERGCVAVQILCKGFIRHVGFWIRYKTFAYPLTRISISIFFCK